jgi:Transposase/Integrase core domain
LANAAHLKAVPGRKTDVRDAEWIAELFRHGLLRASFIPPRPERELRELVRYRTSLIRERASEINRLADLNIRHIRTQIDTPWTNGKVEAFWANLQREVLDRQQLVDLATAEAAVTAYAGYYNYHRLHGELDCRRRPSGSMGRRSPTAASRACPPSRLSPTSSTRCSRPDPRPGRMALRSPDA